MKNFRWANLFLMLTFFFTISSGLNSNTIIPKSDPNFEEVRSRIKDLIKSMNLPSISVAVAKDDEIIWEESFGWANRGKKIKTTPHTMYSLASISKPFTATGLMILAERGLIDLDEPASTYLGEAKIRAFEGDVRDVTVKRILFHTAGLPTHWNFFFQGESHKRPNMAQTINQFGIVISPPGENFEYSNLGYGILEYIIEQVSQKSYAEFMKSEVFEPLGLNRTAVFTEQVEENFIAQRYLENKDACPFYDFDHRGASAVYASAHDLVRFGMFHLKNHLPDQKQILSDETINAMQTEVDPKLPENHYKIGWDVSERYGYMVVSHGGGMPGVRTILLLLPSENTAVVVLCNGVNIDLSRIYNPILAAMFHTYKENWKSGNQNRNSDESDSMPPLAQLEGVWSGNIVTYNESFPVEVHITNQNVKMILKRTSNAEDQIWEPIGPPKYERGFFAANFSGELPIEEALRSRHSIFIKVKLRENNLSGVAGAISFREYYCLPAYIELKKNKGD